MTNNIPSLQDNIACKSFFVDLLSAPCISSCTFLYNLSEYMLRHTCLYLYPDTIVMLTRPGGCTMVYSTSARINSALVLLLWWFPGSSRLVESLGVVRTARLPDSDHVRCTLLPDTLQARHQPLWTYLR